MPPTKPSSAASLPKNWSSRVKAVVLQVISLAQYAIAHARGWAADSVNTRVRLKAENDRLRQEVALLREATRIKDARMARIDPRRRPYYPPTERMAILELRAARGWSLEQTARTFLVTAATIASWMTRVAEEGPDGLVELREPVNKFPDLVRYLVQRLKTLCPAMGKVKIAQTLARAGLHLGATTVGRMLREKPRPASPAAEGTAAEKKKRVVTAKYPGHVFHIDLTTQPTSLGFWCSWLPFALPQCWPWCWWLAVTEDHFSRRAMGFGVFKSQPTSASIRAFLGSVIAKAGLTPRYLICDKGRQFWNDGFKAWCRKRGIRPRLGAVGKRGSIAVIERLIQTTKRMLRFLPLVPLRREAFRQEIGLVLDWYNEHRPHTGLAGRTPNEAYFRRRPSHRQPRFEPRPRWPRGSPSAKPWALVKGKPGTRIALDVEFYANRKHLPLVTLRRVA